MKSKTMSNLVKRLFKFFGIGVTPYWNLIHLQRLASEKVDLDRLLFDNSLLSNLPMAHVERIRPLLEVSKSQLRQDLFVLSRLNFKENGFFVEFGATNGKDLSNTYLLEKYFGWTGVLAEPGQIWQEPLRLNRPNSLIDSSCVWKTSNEVMIFNETKVPELSTLSMYSGADSHFKARRRGRKYSVKTISLLDLLAKHNAPSHIDYLSIDTEGSEFEILNSFDFNRYTFGVITCEHNDSENRGKVFRLLTANGYERQLETLSRVDDWYVRKSSQSL
jgi:FkbM family methyltransferase